MTIPTNPKKMMPKNLDILTISIVIVDWRELLHSLVKKPYHISCVLKIELSVMLDDVNIKSLRFSTERKWKIVRYGKKSTDWIFIGR